jgi:hypothetical protein
MARDRIVYLPIMLTRERTQIKMELNIIQKRRKTYSSLLTCVKLRDNESCHSKMKVPHTVIGNNADAD